MEQKRAMEVLAPAGSLESMKAAVAAGADAVYMGGTKFGARAYADNPDEDGLLQAIDYVHLHGRRLYMTVNTLFKEEELGELYRYLLPYYKEGLDAVIVQDLGAMAFIRRNFPGLDIHASTQMTITGPHGARLMKELGASRVVTARELSLEEIREIREQAQVEIESFVHGALCYCYSGQCLMSSLIGGRSGNRGRCAQPCRLPYQVRSQGGEELNPRAERYVMSLKDLCTLDLIPSLAQAGIDSLKIEGRMKSPRYTAGVVSIYRKYVDRYLEAGSGKYSVQKEDKQALLDLFDRGGFTEGYYTRHNGREMVALKEKPAFRQGNQALFDELDRTYVEAKLKETVKGQAVFRESEPAVLTLRMEEPEAGRPGLRPGSLKEDGEKEAAHFIEIQVKGQIPMRAQNQPMTVEKVLKQLKKTGNTPFDFENLEVSVEGELFMPVQALNEMRRDGFGALEQALLDRKRRKEPQGGEKRAKGKTPGSGLDPRRQKPSLYVFAEEECHFKAALDSEYTAGIYLDAAAFLPEGWKRAAEECRRAGKECFLALPHIFRTHGRRLFETNEGRLKEAGFDGLLIRSLEEVLWLRDTGLSLPMTFDAGVYCWNGETAQVYQDLGAAWLTLPWELNSRELEPAAAAAGERAELVVYGRIPMMVSAQCIRRTVKGCSKKREVLELKDRTGALLPVKNHCAFCYNTVYNPSPLSLLDSREQVEKLGVGRVRLNFITEDGEQAARILRAFGETFCLGREAAAPFKDFTRGHFRRGVQ